MQSQAYKDGKAECAVEEQRFLMEFLPPTMNSNLVQIKYILEVYLSFKGLTLPNTKPVEEIPIRFENPMFRHVTPSAFKQWDEMTYKNWTPKVNFVKKIIWPRSYEEQIMK
jgi:hypothetical protein